MPQSHTAPVRDSQICEQYTPLVEGMVQRLHVPHALREDARHEGFIGLLDAIARYDVNSPVHFAVFAAVYVKGAILRRIYTRTQITETAAEDPYAGQPSAFDTYEIESQVLSAVHIEAWIARLPLSEAWLLRRLYWEDANSDEVAAQLGVTRRRVNQIHAKLLREGAVALGEDG